MKTYNEIRNINIERHCILCNHAKNKLEINTTYINKLEKNTCLEELQENIRKNLWTNLRHMKIHEKINQNEKKPKLINEDLY